MIVADLAGITKLWTVSNLMPSMKSGLARKYLHTDSFDTSFFISLLLICVPYVNIKVYTPFTHLTSS
jgi:hypothetical protein